MCVTPVLLASPSASDADASSQPDAELQKTSLFPHVATFRTAFLAPLLRDSVRGLREAAAAAASGPQAMTW